MGAVMTELLADLSAASLGRRRALDRALRDRRAGSRSRDDGADGAVQRHLGPRWTALGKFFRQEGLYTFVRWNTFFTNPPLCITEEELRDGFAIIDRALAQIGR